MQPAWVAVAPPHIACCPAHSACSPPRLPASLPLPPRSPPLCLCRLAARLGYLRPMYCLVSRCLNASQPAAAASAPLLLFTWLAGSLALQPVPVASYSMPLPRASPQLPHVARSLPLPMSSRLGMGVLTRRILASVRRRIGFAPWRSMGAFKSSPALARPLRHDPARQVRLLLVAPGLFGLIRVLLVVLGRLLLVALLIVARPRCKRIRLASSQLGLHLGEFAWGSTKCQMLCCIGSDSLWAPRFALWHASRRAVGSSSA